MLWIVICFEIVLTVPLIYKNGSVLKKMMQYTIINLLIWYFAHMIEPGRRINTIFVTHAVFFRLKSWSWTALILLDSWRNNYGTENFYSQLIRLSPTCTGAYGKANFKKEENLLVFKGYQIFYVTGRSVLFDSPWKILFPSIVLY